MVMVENARSGFVWETFMRNAETKRGMLRAGFQPNPPPTPHVQGKTTGADDSENKAFKKTG
jgi:hypothetical protein